MNNLKSKGFNHKGKMAELINAYPWCDTVIGPIENWPSCLINSVNIILYSTLPMAVFWGEKGIIIYNDAYALIANKENSPLLGKIVSLEYPEFPYFNETILKYVLLENTLSLTNKSFVLNTTHSYEEVRMDLNYSPILNELEKPVGILCIVRETIQIKLSEEKLIEELNTLKFEQVKLKETEEHLRALITATSEVIYIMNADWSEMGMLQGRIFVPDVGKPSIDWFEKNIPDEEKPLVRQAIDLAIKTKSIFQLEHRVKLVDGNIGWIFSRAIPVFNEYNEIIKWFGSATDITSRKQAEAAIVERNIQLTRTNADLDNFIYTASHDLRAPMSNIEGLLSTFKYQIQIDMSKVTEDSNHLLELMEQSIDRFKKTILDLTEISKINKEIIDDVDEVNLIDLLEEVKLGIENEILKSNAKIITKFEVTNLPFSKKNLKNVVYNLLSNGIKFQHYQRPPEIKITTEIKENFIVLTVSDNGLGIREENQGKLFQMFKRFHDHVEGTGIGLYIVKRIVENAGGKIEVDSELNSGTTFKIYLPQKTA